MLKRTKHRINVIGCIAGEMVKGVLFFGMAYVLFCTLVYIVEGF